MSQFTFTEKVVTENTLIIPEGYYLLEKEKRLPKTEEYYLSESGHVFNACYNFSNNKYYILGKLPEDLEYRGEKSRYLETGEYGVLDLNKNSAPKACIMEPNGYGKTTLYQYFPLYKKIKLIPGVVYPNTKKNLLAIPKDAKFILKGNPEIAMCKFTQVLTGPMENLNLSFCSGETYTSFVILPEGF